MPTDPILYSFRRCPYAMRARLALTVSARQCELREVRLSAKPEAMLVASLKGTVPVLVLPDGRVIDESLDIMRWTLASNDPEDWLARDDAGLIELNDGPFKHDLDRYKYPDRHGDDPMIRQGMKISPRLRGVIDSNFSAIPITLLPLGKTRDELLDWWEIESVGELIDAAWSGSLPPDTTKVGKVVLTMLEALANCLRDDGTPDWQKFGAELDLEQVGTWGSGNTATLRSR